MPENLKPFSEERPLSTEETDLVRWLLQHGIPGIETATFLAQLDQARVVSLCPCGCAGVDFAIAGQSAPAGTGLRVLSDYEWDSDDRAKFGVFVFAKADRLAGLEVWSVDGLAAANSLPKINALREMRGGGE